MSRSLQQPSAASAADPRRRSPDRSSGHTSHRPALRPAKRRRRKALKRAPLAARRTRSRARRTILVAIVAVVAGAGTAVALTRSSSDPAVSLQVRGATAGLAPGISRPLDLTLDNPSAHPIAVTSVTVTVGTVDAPNATTARPCTSKDFQAQTYRADGYLRLDAHTTATLSQLGVPDAKLPAIKMLDRPVNQDGCKSADVELHYRLITAQTTADPLSTSTNATLPRSRMGAPEFALQPQMTRLVALGQRARP